MRLQTTGPEPETMILRLVHRQQIDEMLAEGDCGNMEARKVIYAIRDWLAAHREMTASACACCESELDEIDVHGWVMLLPEKDGAGWIGAYCGDCVGHDCKELMDKFVQHACSNLGLTLATMH